MPSTGMDLTLPIMEGLLEYFRGRYAWDLHSAFIDDPGKMQESFREIPPDGVIAFPFGAFRGGPLWNLGVPVVTILTEDGSLPMIRPDDRMIGRLAAQHLMRPGWSQRAVWQGTPALWRWNDDRWWWRQRAEGWKDVATDGILDSIQVEDESAVVDWLQSIPPRTAIFACGDYTAMRIARLARRQGRHLGHDLRILGVNDTLPCRLMTPTLSSIRIPWQDLGRQATKVLAALLNGQEVPQQTVVPPLGVMIRGSTDPLSDVEPWLRDLAEQVQMAIAGGRKPALDRLIGSCGYSRSTVSRAWKAATGQSIIAWVQDQRWMLAIERQGNGSQEAVAASLGLRSSRSLRRIIAERP